MKRILRIFHNGFLRIKSLFLGRYATESVALQDFEKQLDRQKRQIEMCFSILYEIAEKNDSNFANFVNEKSKANQNVQIIGFKRYE